MKNLILILVTLSFLTACEKIGNKEGFNGDSGTFKDGRDGHTYKWVKIGSQIWMAENLAYNSGEGSWAYGGDEGNAAIYGRLYDWGAAASACPEGWHLPSEDEWAQLALFICYERGYPDGENEGWRNVATNLKSTGIYENGTGLWRGDGDTGNYDPLIEGTDDYGFKALPAGVSDGVLYGGLGYTTIFWTSSSSNDNAYTIKITTHDKLVHSIYGYSKGNGYSVRCIKN